MGAYGMYRLLKATKLGCVDFSRLMWFYQFVNSQIEFTSNVRFV